MTGREIRRKLAFLEDFWTLWKPLNLHFSNFKHFRGTSKIVQNELLDCILGEGQDEMRTEMKEDTYVNSSLVYSKIW